MNYEGDAYVLSDDLWICVYRPEADLHFPISTSRESRWRILNWAIVNSQINSDVLYIVIAAPKSNGCEPRPLAHDLLELETQFGRRTIRISQVGSAGALDSYIGQAFCSSLLKCLSEEPEEYVRRNLQYLLEPLAIEQLNQQRLGAEVLGAEPGIIVEGVRMVRYIVSFGGGHLDVHPVRAITLDCASNPRTIMRTRDKVKEGHVLLLSHIDYKFAELS